MVPATSSKVHKPHLDEMHGPESLPYRPGGAAPRKPGDDTGPASGSKIFQPTDSRQSGPEFGPAAALQRRRAGASGRVEEEVGQIHLAQSSGDEAWHRKTPIQMTTAPTFPKIQS